MSLRSYVWLVVLFGAACGGDSTSAPPPPRLASLSVSIAASSIVAGTSTTVTASGRDQNGQPIAIGAVAWVSSSGVATVDQSGQVTGVAPGLATITGTSGGFTASVAVTVTPAPTLTRLVLTAANSTLRSGERTTLTVTGNDQFNAPIAVPTVTWSSAAPNVATVESDGRVLGILAGSATVTARANGVVASTVITVVPGAAVRLGLIRPASGVFNSWRFQVQPQVEIVDAAGNRITSDNATVVQLGANSPTQGGLTATAVNGLATFTNVGVVAPVGAAVTLAFFANGLSSTSQVLTVAPFSFGNGVRLVGTDIRPGRYRSVNAASASCYWARLRNTTGANDIIANDLGPGPRLLEVLATDVAVESSRCEAWVEISGPATTSRSAPFTDGAYLVGVDIDPGTWRADGGGTSCYWARLRNINGTDDIIGNYLGSTPATMTVLSTDVAVTVSRCGSWTRVP
ncbi:MAG: Ig-like domain-containing protein [Gemmatimonadaceae bacterium]|nr:Ig-like domain-containing protein [Gemmatimonadaceae bacterium]